MKYIIEVEDNPMFLRNGDMLWKAKGFNTLVFDKNGLDKLQKYEEFTINKTAELKKEKVQEEKAEPKKPEKEKVQEEKTEPKKPEKNSKAIKISVGEDEFIDALRDLIGLLF